MDWVFYGLCVLCLGYKLKGRKWGFVIYKINLEDVSKIFNIFFVCVWEVYDFILMWNGFKLLMYVYWK